ncbi:MAG: RDD family protein [Sulfuriferula sp.]
MTTITYSRLIKRVRAILIDSILLPIVVFGTLIIGGALDVAAQYGKAMLILIPILVLEPGLVAFTGGTVGHHMLGIRVVKRDGSGNINIFAATIRFVVKLVFGWLSFIFVLTTTKHQAVHDLLAGSIVVHKDPTGLPAYEILSERTGDSDAYIYPPGWRRIVIIALYWILATVALGIITNVVSTSDCTRMYRCTTIDHLLEMVLSIAWLVGLGWITVRGWSGKLYGCRRRPREAA